MAFLCKQTSEQKTKTIKQTKTKNKQRNTGSSGLAESQAYNLCDSDPDVTVLTGTDPRDLAFLTCHEYSYINRN